MLIQLASTLAIVATVFTPSAKAECANGCNGHGKCTAYDMCICHRNWQGNDCSQRVCQFGLAHVDTPKGDLDMSGGLSGPNTHVVDNHPVYPYGTTEQFPQMEDSDLRPLTNSAHYYMECSNKGSCNRQTGECQCFDGYDGVACQRASCPGFPANTCSGHGVCKTISQLASSTGGNVYKLWDQHSTMGCECDPGYYGPDCSLRDCKHGVDPLYLDDAATAKVGVYDFAVLTTGTAFTDGMARVGEGKWAIRFFDSFGEDWLTTSIPAWATCAQVVAALEGLPNKVIPSNSVQCSKTEYTSATNALSWQGTDANQVKTGHTYNLYYKMAVWNALASAAEIRSTLPAAYDVSGTSSLAPDFVGDIYHLKFTGNPGALKEPQIEIYLDGKRPSLLSPGNKVVTFVVTDGQQGEDVDHFADHCDGVTVTIDAITGNGASDYVALGGLTTAEEKLLKACLGDSNGDESDNVEVYNWDHGSAAYPHLIKLVRTVTSYQDGGYYAALYYDSSTFKLVNPFLPPDELATNNYDVYTTKGVLKRTSDDAVAIFGFGQRYAITTQVGAWSAGAYDGDLSCEDSSAVTEVDHCLNHSDIITFLDFTNPGYNPPYINLYKAQRVYTRFANFSISDDAKNTNDDDQDLLDTPLERGTHIIETDLTINWGVDDAVSAFNVYKFVPDTSSSYTYVASCSNRGICNEDSGVCSCFSGYTNDNCDTQNSLAL